MFRNTIRFGALLFLAGAVLFWTPGPTQAAPHGHGGGGFRAGGFHTGGFHTGGFHVGGFNRGSAFHHGGYGAFRGYYGGIGYNRPYYYSNYYPGYSSYLSSGYYPYAAYSTLYPYANFALGAAAAAAQTYPQDLPPTTDGTARIQLRVPPSAEVWFAGTKTTSTGPIREFQSPPLEPGGQYTYEVRARWMEEGKEVSQSQKVTVWAGANLDVRFPVPPTSEPLGQPEKQPNK